MAVPSNSLRCDGCGFPASAAHIAGRLERLELATRFRPIHMQTLFIGLAPALSPQDDFYRAPESDEFFESFLDAVGVPAAGPQAHPEANPGEARIARLVEFERRGDYLAWLSECPLEAGFGGAEATKQISGLLLRLGPIMVKRIQLNYRPRHIVLLSKELFPLRGILAAAGIDRLLVLDRGEPLHFPGARDLAARSEFRAALEKITSSAAPPPV